MNNIYLTPEQKKQIINKYNNGEVYIKLQGQKAKVLHIKINYDFLTSIEAIKFITNTGEVFFDINSNNLTQNDIQIIPVTNINQ